MIQTSSSAGSQDKNSPINFQGWAKFVIFDPNQAIEQNAFYRNDAFYEQQKRQYVNNTESDNYGPINIPSDRHFFFILSNENLYALSARRNDLSKTQEVLNLKSLLPQVEGSYEGGVEDQGNFKEGFCFKLNIMSGSSKKIWVVCLDDQQKKIQWMNSIIKNQLNIQSLNYNVQATQIEGEAVIGDSTRNGESNQYQELGPDGRPLKKAQDQSTVKKDGYWIILQQWSSCSLACGGGSQTLHRFCVQPQNGGQPCVGSPIQTRSCNIQPCPEVQQINGGEEQNPTRVKMMRISQRPQRFETCIIKEGDLDLIRDDLIQFQRKPRVPARVVLNNMTFTVFQSDHYDTIFFSATLENIEVLDSEVDKTICFKVIDTSSKKTVQLCTMQAVTDDLQKDKENWVQQIYFFRDKCHRPLEIIQDDPILKIKQRALEEAQMDLKAQANLNQNDKIDQMSKGLEKLQQLALEAMKKELKYETSAEQEEILRERQEELNLKKKLEELKEKQECIQRDFLKKHIKQENQMQVRDMEGQINDLKENIKAMILKARAKQSKKLQVMRKLAERRRRAQQQQIQSLRIKMTTDLLGANKKGNMTQCVSNKITQSDLNSYCDCNFGNDVNSNRECKDREWYCWMCCENEFGQYHGSERDKCYAQCDLQKNGNWVWVPQQNKVTPK